MTSIRFACGLRLPDGDLLLPAMPPHREAADVPAKRRRAWERRQRRIADLAGQIAQSVAALGEQGAPEAAVRVRLPDFAA